MDRLLFIERKVLRYQTYHIHSLYEENSLFSQKKNRLVLNHLSININLLDREIVKTLF